MSIDVSEHAVRKSVVVHVSQASAFSLFTEQHGLWWPLETHHIGSQPAQTAVIEPRVGGRWFERSSDGVECDWGRVLVWEPPRRIVLAWQIGSDWKFNPNLITEVEVRFTAEGRDKTRVELEHRNLDRYGDTADAMQKAFDSPGGWEGALANFATLATGATR
jgi:uncharacterized protein YndB with AHSA1/START domain